MDRVREIENKKNGVGAYTNFLMAKVMLKLKKYDNALKHLDAAKTALSGVDYGVLFKFRLHSLRTSIATAKVQNGAE